MGIYDLYGIETEELVDAKLLVEKLLCLEFEEHDSSYHRGPYFSCGQMSKENFEIKINLDPFEDVPNDEAFSNHRILLYINNTPRSTELSALLTANSAVTHLRHEDLT